MGELTFPFMKKQKTDEEVQVYTERLKIDNENEELQLSIAQKQALRRKLEVAGLTLKKDFNGSLKRAWTWLNKTK